jgi:hypothetical protein
MTERLAYTVGWGDDVWIEQGDVGSLRMSVCQQCLMEIRKPGRDGASVAAASYHEHPDFVLQQFGMNMM